MAITLKDVAEHAGVSRSAVSRTFTDGASVSGSTRKKVEEAARKLGYHPSLIARSLATSRTKLIGLVTNNFENPLYLEIFDRSTRELQNRGFRPLIVNLTDETDPEKPLQLLHQYNVDGVIVAGSTLPAPIDDSLQKAGIPVVHTMSSLDIKSNRHVVGTDDIECGERAASTLASRGYKSVGFIGGPQTSSSTMDRFKGFKMQARKLGLKVAVTSFGKDYSYESGRAEAMNLDNLDDMEAIFAADDILCIGAMDAARKRGKSIPADIGFIGVNDLAMAKWDSYDLTTIAQPINDIIVSSIEMVIAMMDNPQRSPEYRRFPCRIIERSTLRPYPK